MDVRVKSFVMLRAARFAALFSAAGRRVDPARIVLFAVGLILLTAAALKTHQLATEPVLGTGILNSRWFLAAGVEFELFVACGCLLSGLLPRLSWAAALACFGLFAGVSLSKALSGEATCGCLGSRLPVNPWYMAGFDFVAVLSLLFWRPRSLGWPMCGFAFLALSELRSLSHRSTVTIAAVWLLLGVPAALAMGSYTDTILSDAYSVLGEGGIVVLEPEKWVGKPFPLLEHIDIGKRLSKGRWKVILYHHDCPQCQEVIARYESLLSKSENDTGRVAAIELPPYGSLSESALATDSLMPGRIDNAKEWFVITPAEFEVDDGWVTHVSF